MISGGRWVEVIAGGGSFCGADKLPWIRVDRLSVFGGDGYQVRSEV